MNTTDVIVIGVGGMGSAACFHLASRGVRVIGLERFQLIHTNGSSHGESRMIRKAYFEHEDYVPLLNRAYALWDDLSHLSGRELFHRTGVLYGAKPESTILTGVKKSAKLHSLELLHIDREQREEEYGVIRLPASMEMWLEPNAGYLEVENCVAAHIDGARKKGADIREYESLLGWKSSPTEVQVKTDKGEYTAKKLVLTTGAWRTEQLSLPIQVHRNIIAWFDCDTRYERDSGMPCFGFDLPEGFLYGFPRISAKGFKAALHKPGDPSNPDKVDRTIHPHDTELLSQAVGRVFPGVKPVAISAATCLYCMSPDENFIVDKHPIHDNVVFAAGFSGHGFKFSSVIGEVLADLALAGKTDLPVEFLGLKENRTHR